MRMWPQAAELHHALLQTLVALCKDNSMMKAHITVTACPTLRASLTAHAASGAVADRGFTLLGVLQSGGDHLNDGVRRLLAEAQLLKTATAGLRAHAAGDEGALTAVCFSVAMLLRGAAPWRETVKWQAARSGVLDALAYASEVCS